MTEQAQRPVTTIVDRSEIPNLGEERLRNFYVTGPQALVVCRVAQKIEDMEDLGIQEPVLGGNIDQVIAQVAVGIRYLTNLEKQGLLP